MWTNVRLSASILDAAPDWNAGILAVLLSSSFPGVHEELACFFSPFLVFAGVLAVRHRSKLRFGVVLIAVLLMVPTIFPGIDAIFIGPLASFRFPAKFTVYFGPLAAALLFTFDLTRAERSAASILALCVLVNTLGFQRWATSLFIVEEMGAPGLFHAAEQCLAELEVRPGTRIAFLGSFKHGTSPFLPPALLGLGNSAALLHGLTTAHVYDPMEPFEAAMRHQKLTAFWRRSVKREGLEAPEQIKRFADAAVQYLVTDDRENLPSIADQVPIRSCKEGLYGAPLPGAIPEHFPWIDTADGRKNVNIEIDGTILTDEPSDAPPVLDAWRKVRWEPLPDHRWRGIPAGPPVRGIFATIVLACVAILLQFGTLPTRWLGRGSASPEQSELRR